MGHEPISYWFTQPRNALSQTKLQYNIAEMGHTDVRLSNSKWADASVAEALRLKARVILIIGGFPYKGLSHARQASRQNLKNKDSIFF